MNLLFFGGKRLLGNSLLNSFSKNNNLKITVIYRNTKPKIFNKSNNINFIKCDRSDYFLLRKKISKTKFDLVFDNNCYNLKNCKILFKILDKKKIFYFFTSSIVSYFDFNKIQNERNHYKKTSKKKIHSEFNKNIAINKKKIEIFLEKGKVNHCILKMHNIIGNKDHSKKTHFLINLNRENSKNLNLNPKDKIQFLYLNDGVKIINILLRKFLKQKKLSKIYNIANNSYNISSIINLNKHKNTKLSKKEIIENVITSNTKIKKETYINFTPLSKIITSLI